MGPQKPVWYTHKGGVSQGQGTVFLANCTVPDCSLVPYWTTSTLSSVCTLRFPTPISQGSPEKQNQQDIWQSIVGDWLLWLLRPGSPTICHLGWRPRKASGGGPVQRFSHLWTSSAAFLAKRCIFMIQGGLVPVRTDVLPLSAQVGVGVKQQDDQDNTFLPTCGRRQATWSLPPV
jgi:hypothetical protein